MRWTTLIGLWLFALTDLKREYSWLETFEGFPLFWRKPTNVSSLESIASVWPLAINLAACLLVAMGLVVGVRRLFLERQWSPNEIGANVVWCMAMAPILLLGFYYHSTVRSWNGWPEQPDASWNDEPTVEERCDFRFIGWTFDVRHSPLFPQCRWALR